MQSFPLSKETSGALVGLPCAILALLLFLVGCGSNSGASKTTTPTLTATTTTLTASTTASNFNDSVPLKAAVSPTSDGGTVSFYEGNTLLGSSAASGGSSTFSTTTLSVATHTISAMFSGTSAYQASTSNSVNVTVSPIAAAAPTLTPSGGAVNSGQSVMMSVASQGTTIFYTLDGTTPTTKSVIYSASAPPVLSTATTVKAVAAGGNYTTGPVTTGMFTILPPPSVTLSSSVRTLTVGGSVTLSWTSTNADSCTASGDATWTGSKTTNTTATQSLTPAGTGFRTFTIVCSRGSASATANVNVAVSAASIACPLLLIPNYIYPTTPLPSRWVKVVSDPFAAYGKGRLIVADDGNGESTAIDQNYVNAVRNVQSAGAGGMVYVHTATTPGSTVLRPIEDVKQNIRFQIASYKPVGVFIDETIATSANLLYYQQLVNLAATLLPNGGYVVLNVGNLPDESYAYSFTPSNNLHVILNVFEGPLTPDGTGHATWAGFDPVWLAKYPAFGFSALVYSTPDIQSINTALDLAIRRNIGWVDVTSRSYSDIPFNDLPSDSYFAYLTSTTNTGCKF